MIASVHPSDEPASRSECPLPLGTAATLSWSDRNAVRASFTKCDLRHTGKGPSCGSSGKSICGAQPRACEAVLHEKASNSIFKR
jgi:hypothetical protein